MSLIDDLRDWYKEESYPPSAWDIDDVEQIAYEVIDDSPRWGNVVQIVYKRGDELAAVEDIEPATEMQGWGDYGEPEIYKVSPVEVKTIKYERV